MTGSNKQKPVIPFHFFPHLNPNPRTLPTTRSLTTTTSTMAPNTNVFNVASEASVSILLAFFMLMSKLRRNSKATSTFHKNDKTLSLEIANRSKILACDFEDGWCKGWIQSQTDELQWEVHKGPTSTEFTGPDVDHTKKDAGGSYAYVKTTESMFGNAAVFHTPSVSLNDYSNYCFRFWYHMHGEGMGSLTVSWNPGRRLENTDPNLFLIASKQGQQSENGTDWKEIISTIESPSVHGFREPVYFEFQATRGLLSTSDIAVDDISLTPGACGRMRRQIPSLVKNGKCGQLSYDVTTHKCCSGQLKKADENKECCGSSLYNPVTAHCCSGNVLSNKVLECCGGNIYNKTLMGCCSGKLYFRYKATCKDNTIVKRRGLDSLN